MIITIYLQHTGGEAAFKEEEYISSLDGINGHRFGGAGCRGKLYVLGFWYDQAVRTDFWVSCQEVIYLPYFQRRNVTFERFNLFCRLCRFRCPGSEGRLICHQCSSGLAFGSSPQGADPMDVEVEPPLKLKTSRPSRVPLYLYWEWVRLLLRAWTSLWIRWGLLLFSLCLLLLNTLSPPCCRLSRPRQMLSTWSLLLLTLSNAR